MSDLQPNSNVDVPSTMSQDSTVVDKKNHAILNQYDVFHLYFNGKYTHKHYVCDTILVTNICLFLGVQLCAGLTPFALENMLRICTYMLVVYFIRGITVALTTCDCTEMVKTNRPRLSRDTYWFMISGHTATTLLFTYLIFLTTSNTFVRIISVLLSIMVMGGLIVTQEHNSCDIPLTIFIVWLLVRGECRV